MAAITLDDVLNFFIPIAVWCFLGFILYKPFKEPIDALWNRIQEWKDGRQDEDEPWENVTKTIEYQ